MTVPVGAVRCSCTPLLLKRTPSASSAETTRCRARALALGTLPLDPSQAVRQGREIEARSASSCCDRPVRLRAARNMPPVISTIVMLRLFAQRQRASKSAYFTNSLTPPVRLGLLVSPCGWAPSRPGSARLGFQKDGLPSRRGQTWFHTVQGHQLAHRGGAAWSLPLSNREQEWTPKRATLLCSPPCRSFAQALPGLWITLFSARPFLRSAQLGYSA